MFWVSAENVRWEDRGCEVDRLLVRFSRAGDVGI
jgi:hypothetical protein